MKLPSVACLISVLAVVPAAARAQEQRIPRSALPPAVDRAVTAAARGAVVREFSRERDNGQTYYEAALLVRGHSKDVLFDSTGAIVEVEEEVVLQALPAPVRAALTRRAAGGKIVSVESLTKHDRLVAYEAHLLRGGKRSEIQVGPGGETLEHEE